MKPSHATTSLDTNVTSIGHQFTVKMTPQLAKLLSAQTYTDRSLAVVRESITNAYDAHVRAGTTDTPAYIHVPTAFEPWYSIRDYGTGLSQADILTYFFSYGASDKLDTNDEIGGFGIGCKAWAAYSDQAVLTTYFNGRRYKYSLNKGQHNLPQGMLVECGETDELNGLELHVPVSFKDVQIFRSNIQHVLTYLDFKYTSNAVLKLDPPEVITSVVVDGYKADLVSSSTIEYPHVLMGGVLYKIPTFIYGGSFEPYRKSCILHLPIGRVDISASRETLSPSAVEQAFLNDMIVRAYKGFESVDYAPILNKCESWSQACLFSNVITRLNTAYKLYEYKGWSIGNMPNHEKDARCLVSEYNYRKKAYRYKSEPLRAAHCHHIISKVLWAPPKSKISTNEFSDTVLVLNSETLEEATKLHKFLGLGKELPIECIPAKEIAPKVRKPRASKPTETRVWIERNTHVPLSQIDMSRAIYVDRRCILGTVKLYDTLDGNPIELTGIYRYCTDKKKGEKLFGHLPKTAEEWAQRNVDKFNIPAIEDQFRWAYLHHHWHIEWPRFRAVIFEETNFPRRMLEDRNRPLSAFAFLKPNDVDAWHKEVVQWMKDEFEKYPDYIRNWLCNTDYMSEDTIFWLQQYFKLYYGTRI